MSDQIPSVHLQQLLARITILPGRPAANILSHVSLQVAFEIIPYVTNWDNSCLEEVLAERRAMRLLFHSLDYPRASPKFLIEQSPFVIPYSADLDNYKPSSHSLFLIQDEIFYDQLVAEGAGAEAVPSLSKLMPKLDTLEVAIGLMNTSDAMRKVAAIIIDLNTRLVHLKVFCSHLKFAFSELIMVCNWAFFRLVQMQVLRINMLVI